MAGRAARWAAACCGWSCACLMVCGGRAARPTGSSIAQGASMPMRAACEAAARLACKVSVRRGTRVCVHAVGAGGRGGRRGLTAVRVGWSSAWRGRACRRPCRHRVHAREKKTVLSWYTKNGLPLPGATLWQAVMSVVWLVQPIRTWYIYIYAATCRPVRGTDSGFFHGLTIVAVVAPMAASRCAIGTLASSSTGGNTTKPTSHKSDGDAEGGCRGCRV